MDPELLAELLRQGATPDQVRVFLQQHHPAPRPPRGSSIGAAGSRDVVPPRTGLGESLKQGIATGLSGATFGLARRLPQVREQMERARAAGHNVTAGEILAGVPSGILTGAARLPGWLLGAGIGAAGGLGHTAGLSRERQAAGTAGGAVTGAALTAAVPAVLRPVGRIAAGTAAQFRRVPAGARGETYAARMTAHKLQEAGIHPSSVLQEMQDVATTPAARAQVRPIAFTKEVGEKLSGAAIRGQPAAPRAFEGAMDDLNRSVQTAGQRIQAAIDAAPPAGPRVRTALQNMSDEGKRLMQDVLRTTQPGLLRANAMHQSLIAQGVPDAQASQMVVQHLGPDVSAPTLKTMDAVRKELGARMSGLQGGQQHLVDDLRADRALLDEVLGQEFPAWALARKEWQELTNLTARTARGTRATKLPFEKTTRVDALPQYRFTGAAAGTDPALHFLQARGLSQAGIGRMASGAANLVADILRQGSKAMSNKQAFALTDRLLRPGPEGVAFVRRVISEAEKLGRPLLPFETAQLWGMVAGHSMGRVPGLGAPPPP